MNTGISPSTFAPGRVQVSQGWPKYLEGGDHDGIDVVCGVNDADEVVAVEPVEIIKIWPGNEKSSGYVKMLGKLSDMLIYYKHIGEFRVKVGDVVEAGTVLGKPNLTNTKEKHLHMEVWNGKRNENPIEYLLKIQPFLIYIHSEKESSLSYKTAEWYKEKYPELYDRMFNV